MTYDLRQYPGLEYWFSLSHYKQDEIASLEICSETNSFGRDVLVAYIMFIHDDPDDRPIIVSFTYYQLYGHNPVYDRPVRPNKHLEYNLEGHIET